MWLLFTIVEHDSLGNFAVQSTSSSPGESIPAEMFRQAQHDKWKEARSPNRSQAAESKCETRESACGAGGLC